MGIERLAAIESARLVLREPIKYGGLVAGLYLLSLKDKKLGTAIRTSYLFLRHIDDYLDEGSGNRDEKLPYVLKLREEIELGQFDGGMGDLAKCSLQILANNAGPDDNPKQDFLTAIDAMVFDYQRSKERRVLSRQELDEYYHDTFFSVVNLTLIGFNSQFRASDIPELSYGQGRVFSVRDLDEDWQRGVINIPKEILWEANLNQYSKIAEVRSSAIIREWLISELSQSREGLIAVKIKLDQSGEKLTSRLCNGVTKTASQLLRRYNAC